jgi:hypothetical protein
VNALACCFRNQSTRRGPANWRSAANRAEPLNLRFERAPTLNIWRSDTGMLHSPDTPYGRTCHRCTCHPHEQPWGETQGLKHNRGIELCLSFLNLFELSCMQDHSASKAYCAPLRRALEFPDAHFHSAVPYSCNFFWPFPFRLGSGLRIVALEQVLDPLDRALQLVDQIFIGKG